MMSPLRKTGGWFPRVPRLSSHSSSTSSSKSLSLGESMSELLPPPPTPTPAPSLEDAPLTSSNNDQEILESEKNR